MSNKNRAFICGLGTFIATTSLIWIIFFQQPALIVTLCIGIAIIAASLKSKG